MSHDNQPFICYQCERTVERWSVDPVVHEEARVVSAECHGDKDSATLHVSTYRDVMDGGLCRPLPMFMPPWDQTCPAKLLMVTGGAWSKGPSKSPIIPVASAK